MTCWESGNVVMLSAYCFLIIFLPVVVVSKIGRYIKSASWLSAEQWLTKTPQLD